MKFPIPLRLIEIYEAVVAGLRHFGAWLNFAKKRRERLAKEKQEEREFMLDLIDTALEKVVKLAEVQRDQSVAQSQSTAELAQVFKSWLEMFKQQSDDPNMLTSETVRPADEYEAEQQRIKEDLIAKGFPVNASAAEQLAWLVDNPE